VQQAEGGEAMNFFFRNPAYCLTNPRKAWATRKAMEEYRREHPICAFTGRAPVHVHHVEPIQYAPERAAEKGNMISLAAASVHHAVGHAGDWKRYVENVRELCEAVRIGMPAAGGENDDEE
jgi:hypothetical protein